MTAVNVVIIGLMCVPEATIVFELIQLIWSLVTSVPYEEAKEDVEEPELKKEKCQAKNKTSRGTKNISLTFHSTWIYVAFLLHILSGAMVEAVCAPRYGSGYLCPHNGEMVWVSVSSEYVGLCQAIPDLVQALNACLDETPDGSCPIFAASSNGPGCNNGGINGVIGDWDVSRVAAMGTGQYNEGKGLFQDKASFNADISKWATQFVSDMSYST
jgi:hypothetical protein